MNHHLLFKGSINRQTVFTQLGYLENIFSKIQNGSQVLVIHACNLSWRTEIGRITVGGHLGQILHKTPIFKFTRAKWMGGMAHVTECLLCKQEALSSNSSCRKQTKKKISAAKWLSW
jgi:hypothetical protein